MHIIKPYTDLTQSYLKYLSCYKEALELAGEIWNRYAPTIVFFQPMLSMDRDVPNRNGARFLIYALENPNEEEDILIVADQVNKNWILISASNREYRDSDYFEVSRSTVAEAIDLAPCGS